MRKVLSSHGEVAHFWANKVQSEGRASAMFFDGDYLYSYGKHFCIARHLSQGVCAFTLDRYSVSTAKHTSIAHYASRHLKKVYCQDPQGSAANNMQAAQDEIKSILLQSCKPRIRQTTKDNLQAQALYTAEQANDYLAALPEGEKEHVQPIDTSTLAEYRESLVVYAQEQAKKEAERKATKAIELKEAMQEWREGKLMHSGSLRHLPVALRLNKEKQIIQTSHNAEIPVKDALKLWPIVNRVMKGEKDYTPGEPLGHYKLTKIRSNGSIVVGCHDIAYTELQTMAVQLGLI